jgi:pimeloyl-ACP methyl ester carboxylesterase
MNRMLLILIIPLAVLTACSSSESPVSGTVTSEDGVNIAYRATGQGKPALLFIHGWCCDQSYWSHQVEAFEADHRVVTVDLAGHGQSGDNRNQWSIPAFGTDVMTVVRALDLKDVILIGHSMGGPVALEAAARLDDRVLGIIGVDTYQNVEASYSQEQQETFLNEMNSDFTQTTRSFVASMFTPSADSTLVAQVVEDMASSPAHVGISAMKAMFEYDPLTTLKELDVPVHAINSDKWPTNSDANNRHMSFTLKLMPGYGHFIMLEAPKEFNQLLAESITEISS